MSLEAARTRARVQAAYLAQLLPEAGGANLLGYALQPIRSASFRAATSQEQEALGIVRDAAPANQLSDSRLRGAPP
ncbi:MAG: hypothetical protein ABSF94_16695 [Steroidobacteraceae bacterium]